MRVPYGDFDLLFVVLSLVWFDGQNVNDDYTSLCCQQIKL